MAWESRQTARGSAYTTWVDPLPRVEDWILEHIVYLYPDRLEADAGSEHGGSGFVLAMLSDQAESNYYLREMVHLYVVTNKHIIENGFHSIRFNTSDGKHDVLNTSEEEWKRDESNDLAVFLLPQSMDTSSDAEILMTPYPFDRIVTPELVEAGDLGIGSEVMYVGRFVGHGGRARNIPSVRFGTISMMPDENDPVNQGSGLKSKPQVSFLVETRSRSGYSGSPVFFHTGPRLGRQKLHPGRHLVLLGVDWGHIPERIPLMDPGGHLHGSKWFVEVHAGMMGVVPGWKLRDFLLSPDLVEQRRHAEDAYVKNRIDNSGLVAE